LYEPFIFPFQATKVFFSNDIKKFGWKIVLRKEAQSTKEVVDTEEDVFITTSMEVGGLNAPNGLPPLPSIISLIEAIKLPKKDNLLTLTIF
jgi:hypothetical protein